MYAVQTLKIISLNRSLNVSEFYFILLNISALGFSCLFFELSKGQYI